MNNEKEFKIGQKVLFMAEKAGKTFQTGGTIHQELGKNLWEIVGFGFTAHVKKDDDTLRHNPNFDLNGYPKTSANLEQAK